MPKKSPAWIPGERDYVAVISAQNPWLTTGGSVPPELAPAVERPLAKRLWKRVRDASPHRFQFIIGPRRVGKTTCMYQTVRHLLVSGVPVDRIWWLRLDHPLLMKAELGQLVKALIKTHQASVDAPLYLFLDEISYADDWDLWLKTFFDERFPVRIVATSSATAALKKRRMESGVGRWEDQYLAPYLLTEFLELRQDLVRAEWFPSAGGSLAQTLSTLRGPAPKTLQALRQSFLLTGGFPELLIALGTDAAAGTQLVLPALDAEKAAAQLLKSQRVLRDDAIERAIYKDIPQTFGVDDPLLLERLLYTLGGQMTGLLSPQNLCSELGLSQPTLDKYLSYLERAFLIFTLTNYSPNPGKTQRRGRKLYFVDSAVRNAALQRGLAPLDDPSELGMLLENMVAGHLYALSQQSEYRLYHWRAGNKEVDFILDHPSEPLAFEIGSSPRQSTKGLRALMERHPRFRGRCYLVFPQAETIHPSDEEPIGFVALDQLLVSVARQAEAFQARRLTA